MACPQFPHTEAYAEFSARLRDTVVGRHIPISGSIELTERCNLRCAHCYINLPASDEQARSRELSTQELRAIVDAIVDEGCLWLLFTGGEPFVRPDFPEIYTYARQKGLLISLFTNGTTITPARAAFLAEWRPYSIEITLYGYTKETYERVTGVPGSFERCKQGIELLLERGLPLQLKSMILSLNVHEVGAMRAHAEELGVPYRFDAVTHARADGDQTPTQYRISAEEVLWLDALDSERAHMWQTYPQEAIRPTPEPEKLYQCGAGVNAFHIDAYGNLSLCIMAREPAYSLREGSFHEGWHTFIPQTRAQQRTKPSPCQTCDLITMCTQCPGIAHMEYGDAEQCVPHLCEITHLRADMFGLKGDADDTTQ